jgi:hypothetical protein
MLNPTKSLKTTARQLVRDRFGQRRVSRAAVQEAFDQALRHGWMPVYLPGKAELDRDLVLVPQGHQLAAVVRCLSRDGCGTMPIGLVESHMGGMPFRDNALASMHLAKFGLAIMACDRNTVTLRGTAPRLACLVNLARHGLGQGFRCEQMVEAATAIRLRARHITDDLRLRAAIAFDQFEVDVPGLLAGEAEPDLVSRWTFPKPPPPPGPKAPTPGPHPPAAPIDPDMPPF